MAICKHLGGGQVYIPRGQVLDSFRILRIWNDFNGRNVSELTTRYGVTFNTALQGHSPDATAEIPPVPALTSVNSKAG